MAFDLFKEWIPSITEKREYLFADGSDVGTIEKDYPAYMINRALSQYVDTVLQANEMNVSSSLPAKMQYDYLYHNIEKRKRFSKWAKGEKDEVSSVIMQVYGVSYARAIEMAELLGESKIAQLKEYLEMGGKKK